MPSICTADSDDEVVNFANQTDSDSDSEDNLMVSQELWAGFSVQAFANQMDSIEELSGHEVISSPSSHSLGSGSESPMLTIGHRSAHFLFYFHSIFKVTYFIVVFLSTKFVRFLFLL